jgi:hypothetical protein
MRNSLSMLMAMMLLGGTGCEIRKAMYDQPKYRPLQKSEFFADARASRPLVAGTVARDHLNEDAHLYTGKVGDQLAGHLPVPGHPRGAGARPGALQHLLRALP